MIDNDAYPPREMSADVCPTCARLREWAEYVQRVNWWEWHEARMALENHMREHGELVLDLR